MQKRSRRSIWVPTAIFALIATIFIGISIFGRHREFKSAHAYTILTSEQVAIRLEDYFEVRILRAKELVETRKSGRLDSQAAFTQLAEGIQRHLKGMLAINWVDTDGIIRWVVPLKPNREALGRNLRTHPFAGPFFRSAESTGDIRFTPPIELYQGGTGIAAYFPVVKNGEHQGVINMAFRINPIVDECLDSNLRKHYAVRIVDGQIPVYESGNPGHLDHHPMRASHAFEVGDRVYTLTLAPARTFAASAMVNLALILGFLLGLGLALLSRKLILREEQLAESERRYRTIFENAQVGLFRTDTHGKILDANKAMAETFGYTHVKTFIEEYNLEENYIDQADHERLQHEIQTTAAVNRFETRYIRKDGSPVWVRFSAKVFPEKGYMEGLGTSIDDEKTAMAALIESEEKFRALAETTSAMILMTEPDGEASRVVYANPAAIQNSGYSWEELRKIDANRLLGAEGRTIVEHADALAARGEPEPTRMEVDIINAHGDQRWFEMSRARLEVGGRPVLLSTSFDITERKRAEEALMESERKFRVLSESTSAAIHINKSNRVIYANRATSAITGYSLEELNQLKNEDILHLDSLQTLVKTFAAMADGQPWPEKIELRLRTATGEERWVETTIGRLLIEGEEAEIITSFDITDRRRAEAALKESEAKYRTIFENAQVGLFRIRMSDGKILEANRTMALIFGFDTIDDLLDNFSMKSAWVTPDERDRLYRHIEENDNLIDNFEVSFYRKDHQIIWTRFSARAFPEKDYMEGVGQEITEDKKTTQALVESEQKFRALADSTSAAIFIATNERLIYANRAAIKNTGYSIDDLKAMKSPSEMFDSESQTLMERLKFGYMKDDKPFPERVELKVRLKNGETRWIELTAAEFEYEGEEAYISTSFDITERKQAEQTIKASESRYRTIFETTGTGTIIFGENGIISLANSGFASLVGYPREEIETHMPWTTFFDKDSVCRINEHIDSDRSGQTHAPNTYEVRLVNRNGKTHVGLIMVNLVPDSNQRVASFLDLTERKQAEQQMFRSEKMAALGQIIAGVAHEINNPNNFIYFNLPILRRYIEAIKPILDEAAAEKPNLHFLNMPYDVFLDDTFKLIDNMSHGSSRITGIVGELKNYIRSHEIEERKPESIETVIRHVMTLIGKQVQKMVKNLTVSVADTLPPVMMNAGKIEQVLINLIINAGQAADKENSWVKLTAQPHPELSDWLRLTVADNGSGIPESIRDQIFDPFFTTKGRDSGTGLGLAISHRIVEEHEGRMDLQSMEGEGTTFTIDLPAYREEQNA